MGILQLRNYKIVLNPHTQRKVEQYSVKVIGQILKQNSEISDSWMKNYSWYNKSVENYRYQDDSTACFELG
ncbi:MAG: hypothetical protein ACE5SW_09915 [Nitrososphaeraceae archaeon]